MFFINLPSNMLLIVPINITNDIFMISDHLDIYLSSLINKLTSIYRVSTCPLGMQNAQTRTDKEKH